MTVQPLGQLDRPPPIRTPRSDRERPRPRRQPARRLHEPPARRRRRRPPARGVEATVFEQLAELPHYSEELDHDDALPQVARDLREAVADHDAVLLVTPEYNGSLPSALKNAVDWASRPRGASSIAGKPAAVVGASGSPRAAQWAREDGVRVLTVAGAEVIEDTVGVGSAFQAFEEGRLSDRALDAALRQLVRGSPCRSRPPAPPPDPSALERV